jgi:kynurenine formamidase
MRNSTLAAATMAALALGSTAWAQCAPSQWGAEDTIGAANLVTAERIMAAKELIKQGKAHPLGITIGAETPAFSPRSHNQQVVQPNQQGGQKLSGWGYEANYNDDILQTWVGIGSQLDGLGHLGENGLYYNCLDEKEIAPVTGLTKLGTHDVPPLVGRAVIVDMAAHFGVDTMEAGQSFGSEDIQAAAEAQGVTMGEGDIILFHTGWTQGMLESDPQAWVAGEPGLSNDGAEYLATLNPIAVGADTWGVESVPPKEGDKVFYGHVIFLKDHGIYILETMNTGPLLEEGVNEFMFVLGQPRIRGTVQAMINPIALY